MAVELLDLNPNSPSFVKLVARPTFICDLAVETLVVDVYLAYQGITRCYYSHVFTYNDSEKEQLTWDNQEEMTGMSKACELINSLNEAVAERDIYNYKKLDLYLN